MVLIINFSHNSYMIRMELSKEVFRRGQSRLFGGRLREMTQKMPSIYSKNNAKIPPTRDNNPVNEHLSTPRISLEKSETTHLSASCL
jgi:hypothetical protein